MTSDRAALVHRNMVLLTCVQGISWAGISVFITVAPVAIFELTQLPRAAGFMQAVYALSIGVGALVIGRLMDRAGRRPGLTVGALLLGLGAVGCAIGIGTRRPAVMVVAAIAYGAG